MKFIRPKVKAPIIEIAKNQPQYLELAGAIVCHPDYPARDVELKDKTTMPFNTILVAFQPDERERQLLAAGHPIYLGVMTFGGALSPILPLVGVEDAAKVYRLEVEP